MFASLEHELIHWQTPTERWLRRKRVKKQIASSSSLPAKSCGARKPYHISEARVSATSLPEADECGSFWPGGGRAPRGGCITPPAANTPPRLG